MVVVRRISVHVMRVLMGNVVRVTVRNSFRGGSVGGMDCGASGAVAGMDLGAGVDVTRVFRD